MTQQEKQNRQRAIGKAVVDLLDLKKNRDGRYDTTWGTKTMLGLGCCVDRIMEEIDEQDRMGLVQAGSQMDESPR